MNIPEFVTFTGVDVFTDLYRLVALSRKYPVEWGVLVGGRLTKAKYPSLARIEEMNHLGHMHDIRCSLHLCGIFAMRAKVGIEPTFDRRGFRRYQINSHQYDQDDLRTLAKAWQADIIYQDRDEEQISSDHLDRVFPLYDCSGGRGVLPRNWPPQFELDQGIVGYAGGIGPDNVEFVLGRIMAKRFWLDMESSLRDENDRFDLDRCQRVLEKIYGIR